MRQDHTLEKQFRNQRTTISGYKDNRQSFVRHGNMTVRYANNAKALSGNYLHGKPHGVWYRWYENGQKMSRHNYVLGELHGPYIQWYESGELALEGEYKRDKPAGQHRAWPKKNTQTPVIYQYKDGIRVRIKQKIKGRQLSITVTKGNFLKGKLNGSSIHVHAKKIAWQTAQGTVIATPIEALIAVLAQIMTPEEVEFFLGLINDIYEEKDLDENKKLLVKCPNGWSSVTLDPSGNLSNPTQTTDQERLEMERSCKAQAKASLYDLTDGAFDNERAWQDYVDQEIARIDGLFDNCKDDNVNPIVMTTQSGGGTPPSTSQNDSSTTEPDENDSSTTEPDENAVNEEKGRSWSESINKFFEDAEDDPGFAVAKLITIAAIIIAPVVLKTITDNFKNAVANAVDPEGDHERKYVLVSLEFKASQALLVLKTVKYVLDFSREDLDLYKIMGDMSELVFGIDLDGPEDVEDRDPDSGLSCADRQEHWERLKQQCDEADWKTLECLSYLGVSTNCLELVQPTPDGDQACYGLSRNPSAFEIQQSLCGSNWLLRDADGYGNDACMELSDVSDFRVPDPCHDPRINWGPEGCIQPVIAQAELTTTPMPGSQDTPIVSVRTDTFDSEIKESSQPVLVIFAAKGCNPCHRVLDAIENSLDEFENRISFKQVDITQNSDLAYRYNITHTPTLIVFNRGDIVGHRRVGAAPPERIIRFIDKSLQRLNRTEA